MGQQQLLLLVIGIVLVALAVVVGLDAFASARRAAEVDAMIQIANGVADDLAVWYARPAVYGGGGATPGRCPFDQPPGALGRPTVDGRPFPGAPPAYPAPPGGTWIDAGGGRYAQLEPASDKVRVVSARQGDLQVELVVHGPDVACRSLRRRAYAGGAWALDAPHADDSACPAVW